jgi:hypothetical protein
MHDIPPFFLLLAGYPAAWTARPTIYAYRLVTARLGEEQPAQQHA